MRYREAYTDDFRQMIVDLVRAGRRPKELAKEFEPNSTTIYGWVKRANKDRDTRKEGVTSVDRKVTNHTPPAKSRRPLQRGKFRQRPLTAGQCRKTYCRKNGQNRQRENHYFDFPLRPSELAVNQLNFSHHNDTILLRFSKCI